MKTFQLTPLALAMTVLAVPAWAQTDARESIEEVEVTASYRDSLAKALDQKRNSVGSRDAILAEDIADFPDLNLAESLQRIPGVAITRDAGEGRNISVRGLGPQFTRVRINGLEAISTTGGTDSSGGANRSRAFDFNTFASELFSNLTVHKTSSADLDEGSLGATVDLNTGKPLNYAENFTFAANGQMGYNDQSEEIDPRTSFLIAGKNEAETFGWLATYSYSKRNILEQGFSAVRWTNAEGNGGKALQNCSACADDAELAALNDGFYPRIPRYGKLTHEQERQGFTGTLQFNPNEDTEILVDYLTSTFDATRQEEFAEVSLKENGNWDEIDVTDYSLNGNGTITSMTVDNFDVRIENRFDELETKFDQFSIRGSHNISDRLRVDGLFGASESNFSNPMQTTAIFDAYDVAGAFTYTDAGTINFGSFDTSNPDNFRFVELRHRPNRVDNTFETIAFNVEYDLSDTFSLKGGVSQKNFEFEVEENRAGPKFDLPTAGLVGGNASVNGVTWVSPNVNAAFDSVAAEVAASMAPRAQDIRSVAEEDTGFYAQLGWDTLVGALPLRGNFGVRQVTTNVKSTGFQDNGELVQVTVENEYDDVLPSLNLALDLNDSMVLRFSASEVMARPALGDLTPGGKIDQFNGKVSYGNPFLEPFRAQAYDLSYEWYFADDAVFAAAYFRKDIESFIVSSSFENQPWSATGLPESVLVDEGTFGAGDQWEIAAKDNGEGGELNGFELQYQQPIMDNFGVLLNYTYVDSEVQYGTGDDAVIDQLTGLSKNTYNATGYYEDEKFSARISYSMRDDYMTQAPTSTRNGNDYEGTLGTTNIDFVMSYNLNDNTTLSFEGINLTDEPNVQVVDSSERVTVDHTTGRQFYLGAQYKF